MPEPRPLPVGPVHFVGIGGAGMSAIAFVLARWGRAVSGSDPGISDAVKYRLEGAGCKIFPGPHAKENVPENIAALVVTDAVKGENPEISEAERRGIPIFKRPEVLGGIVNSAKTAICIAGTHGKTTTTGMVASILLAAGMNPTVLIGGDLPLIGGNARAGDPDLVVAEACEAYGGLDWLRPTIAVILNMEADHLDFHGSEENFREAFVRFTKKTRSKGAVVWCADDNACRLAVAEGIQRSTKSANYGISWSNYPTRFFSKLLDDGFSVEDTEKIDWTTDEIGLKIRFGVPGNHNVLNATAAFGASKLAGVSVNEIRVGLESFTGTGRRFERLGETKNGVIVIDDYAHHPTEIRATLQGARQAYPKNRLVAIFQPHLPSRTDNFMAAFADALAHGGADTVYLTEIYLAREAHRPGLIEKLAERVGERITPRPPIMGEFAGSPLLGLGVIESAFCTLVLDRAELPARLFSELRPGDVAIFMGAGNIREQAEEFLSLGS